MRPSRTCSRPSPRRGATRIERSSRDAESRTIGKPTRNECASPSNGASTRTWLVIAVLFSVFWALYLAFFGPRPPKPTLEGSGTGEPASYDWTLLDLEDRPATFERFKGKAVFLNIWATWCGPCVKEMPSIARLAEDPRLKDKGIAFVCVSIDESGEAVRRFLEGHSWKMNVLPGGELPPVFMTDGYPRDIHHRRRTGGSSPSRSGSAEWDNPETVALLEKLAADAPAAP